MSVPIRGLAVAWIFLAGCAHQAGAIAGEVAEDLPEPLIQSSLRTFAEDDETRRLLVDAVRSPEVRQATAELVSNVTDGTIDALSEDERNGRLAALTDEFVTRVSSALAETMETEIGPAVARTVSRVMGSSLRSILSDANGEQIAAAVAELATEAIGALAISLREELGPELAAIVREDLAPAFREALADAETQEALGAITRTLSREAVLGVQEAFEEIEAREGRGAARDTILTRVQELAGEGITWIQIGLLVSGLALLAAIAWMIRSGLRARALRAESARREAALLALTEALRSIEDRPWADELLDVLRSNLREDEHGRYLRDVLKRSPAGRGRPGPGAPLAPAT